MHERVNLEALETLYLNTAPHQLGCSFDNLPIFNEFINKIKPKSNLASYHEVDLDYSMCQTLKFL